MKTISNTYLRILPAIGLVLILIGYYYYTFQLIDAKKEVDNLRAKKSGLVTEVNNLNARRMELIAVVKQYDSVKKIQEAIINSSKDAKTVQEGKALIAKVLTQPVQSGSGPGSKNLALAEEMEKLGFSYLLKKDLINSMQAFKKSENAFNGYHVVYEIALYLERNKALIAENPDHWKVIYKKILKDYSWNIPKEFKIRLNEQVK